MPAINDIGFTTKKFDGAGNMVTEDDDANCDAHIGNGFFDNLKDDEGTWSKKPKMLDEDLSVTLRQMVSRLCSICRKFHEELEDFSFNPVDCAKVYHFSMQSLNDSANKGCPLCRDLCKNLEDLFEEKPQFRQIADHLLSIWCEPQVAGWGEDDVYLGLAMFFEVRRLDETRLGYHSNRIGSFTFFPATILGAGPEFRDLGLRKTAANSERSIGVARSWYEDCLEVHGSCRDWTSKPIIPTRLIRVQTLGQGASSRIAANLCETKDLPSGVTCPYITLSHRWGGRKMLKLLESNVDQFRRGLPIDQLPVLFKDAMHMTCQLGIEYIWIDSLCILQGSKRDWEVEATRMGDYYRYARCTLSATGYEDGSLGLFSEREALSLIHYPVQLNAVAVTEVDGCEVRVDCKGIFIKADPEDFHSDITRGALSSRGWVAQERTLSPCILHYTPRLMWWECNERLANEAFPDIHLPWSHSLFFGAGAARRIDEFDSAEQLYFLWRRFIEHYASTDLTYDTDRFPAVVGIARFFGSLLDDNFIAGMWEGDLARSLLWQPRHRAKKLPSAQIAPSWSWAPLALAHLYPSSGYPIKGICFRVLSDNPDFQSDLQSIPFQNSRVRGLAVTGPLRRLSGRLYKLPNWSRFGSWESIIWDMEDASLFSGKDTAGHEWRWEPHTHLLPLWKGNTNKHYREVRVIGLLLQQAPSTEQQSTFRRIGIFHAGFLSEELCDSYLGLEESNGSYKPSVDFDDRGFQEFVLV